MRNKAIIYARVSTQDQDEGCQVDRMKAHAKEQNIKVMKVIRDRKSGADQDRVLNLIAKIGLTKKEYNINAVMITSFDRLARDVYLQLLFEKEMQRLGIEITAIKQENLRGEDPATKAMRQIVGVFSEFERAMIKSRLTEGLKRKLEKGIMPQGELPYGYKWDLVNNEKMPVVD